MPLQNRVTPTGAIEASAAHGTFMGNRGILHGPDRTLGRKRWAHHAWIVCVLEWKGRRRLVMSPGAYTELFFLDEAVAFAAGHRPCGECRIGAYRRYKGLWREAFGGPLPSAGAMDRALQAARVDGRAQRRHARSLDTVPDGAFVQLDPAGPALLVDGDRLLPFGHDGYGPPQPRPSGGEAAVLTPAPTLAVLAAGYRPALHPSAGVSRS